jgi:hypothetical protein
MSAPLVLFTRASTPPSRLMPPHADSNITPVSMMTNFDAVLVLFRTNEAPGTRRY